MTTRCMNDGCSRCGNCGKKHTGTGLRAVTTMTKTSPVRHTDLSPVRKEQWAGQRRYDLPAGHSIRRSGAPLADIIRRVRTGDRSLCRYCCKKAQGDWSACRHDDNQYEPCSAHRPVPCAERAMNVAKEVCFACRFLHETIRNVIGKRYLPSPHRGQVPVPILLQKSTGGLVCVPS